MTKLFKILNAMWQIMTVLLSYAIGIIAANYVIADIVEIYVQPVLCVRIFVYIIFIAITYRCLKIITM